MTLGVVEGRETAPPCSGPSCSRDVFCKDLCQAHYDQLRRGNDLAPLRRNRKGMGEAERFWDQVDATDVDGCWPWVGASRGNRGTFTRGASRSDARTVLVHRYSYLLFNPDEDIDGVTIHHKCANSLCVNPDHLQAISHINNVAEMNERQWYLKKIALLEARVAELEAERICNGCCS